jgi:plasmid stability protein
VNALTIVVWWLCYTEDVMANITVTIDDDLLRRARVRAVEQGTSVSAAVAAYLEQYAGPDPAREAVAAFLDLAARIDAGSGGADRDWTREDLHDRANLR